MAKTKNGEWTFASLTIRVMLGKTFEGAQAIFDNCRR
jgi:hypothetical protein